MCQPFHFSVVPPDTPPRQCAAPYPLFLVELGGPGGRSRKWPIFPSQGLGHRLMELQCLLNWSTSQFPNPRGALA